MTDETLGKERDKQILVESRAKVVNEGRDRLGKTQLVFERSKSTELSNQWAWTMGRSRILEDLLIPAI